MRRIPCGLAAAGLALLTGLLLAAGVNFGYPLQPVWLVFAGVTVCCALVGTSLCVSGRVHLGGPATALTVAAVGASLGAVVLLTPAQPSRAAARKIGLAQVGRVPPYPGATVTAYLLERVGPGGDYGPSFLHPPDGYTVSRVEALPPEASARAAVAYYRQALARLGYRPDVNLRSRDAAPADPTDTTVALIGPTVRKAKIAVVAISRSRGRLRVEVVTTGAP